MCRPLILSKIVRCLLFEKENRNGLHGAGSANVGAETFPDARQFPQESHEALALLLSGWLVVLQLLSLAGMQG